MAFVSGLFVLYTKPAPISHSYSETHSELTAFDGTQYVGQSSILKKGVFIFQNLKSCASFLVFGGEKFNDFILWNIGLLKLN